MMMMAIVIFADQFKTSRAVPEVKPFDHAHLFEQVHGAIDGGEIALRPALPHFSENFPIG
jgi:hypothetical protein